MAVAPSSGVENAGVRLGEGRLGVVRCGVLEMKDVSFGARLRDEKAITFPTT
mgnify:FL=1